MRLRCRNQFCKREFGVAFYNLEPVEMIECPYCKEKFPYWTTGKEDQIRK